MAGALLSSSILSIKGASPLVLPLVFVLVAGLYVNRIRGDILAVESMKSIFRTQKLLQTESDEWLERNGPDFLRVPRKDGESLPDYRARLTKFIGR